MNMVPAIRIDYYGQFLALVRDQKEADILTDLCVKAHKLDRDCFTYKAVSVPVEVTKNG